MILIGYSGHAFVVAAAARSAGLQLTGYCDRERKTIDPYDLAYLGPEDGAEAGRHLTCSPFFVAIGHNRIRERLTTSLLQSGYTIGPAVLHGSSLVAGNAGVGDGTLVAGNAVINPLAIIGRGVIINTSAVIEHECAVGEFAHVAPGAVLTGNVSVGRGAFIGAGATIIPGISVGAYATVGAGAVVLRDVPPGATVVGNPAKVIS